MSDVKQNQRGSWLRRTRNVFLTGVLAAIPLAVTYLVFRWLFEAIDSIFRPVVIFFVGHWVPGVGLVAVIILVYLLGLIMTNVIGRSLIRWLDALMCRIPVIQYVYTAAKQVVDAVQGLQQVPFKKVVIVEFPKAGMHSLGFVTGKAIDFRGQKEIPVFIPHTPNPMTGFLVLLPSEGIINTDLSIEDAMRMVLSGGLLSPDTITESLTS